MNDLITSKEISRRGFPCGLKPLEGPVPTSIRIPGREVILRMEIIGDPDLIWIANV